MKRLQRIFYFCLYGTFGGLLASYLHQYFLLDILAGNLSTTQRLFYLGLLGAIVGAAIGFFPSYSEGRGKYSFGGAVRVGIVGAVLGAIGGLIALPLAEAMHIGIGGGLKGRMTAFTFLGLTLGLAEGILGTASAWRGIVGGSVGGLLGGYLLERLLANSDSHAVSGILALMVIGCSISFSIALFVNVWADAWLEGQAGSSLAGHIFYLSKFRPGDKALMGADKKGSVFIFIPDAQNAHAEIAIQEEGVVLRHVASSSETRVNGVPINERLLRNGDMIEIARTSLRYRERREARSSSDADVKEKLAY
jgi:hypothetical protein